MNKEQDKENIEEIKKVIVENSECIPSEMSELVDTLIASIGAEAYEKGFIAGADATGSQAEEVLEEQKQEILEEYNKFLIKNGYADDDLWIKEPTAIDRFLNNK